MGHVLWLAEKVAGLAASIDDAGREAPLIVQYRRERAHLVKVAAVAIACGIAERQTETIDRQTDILLQALRLTVAESGLGAMPDIDAIFRAHVAELEGEA